MISKSQLPPTAVRVLVPVIRAGRRFLLSARSRTLYRQLSALKHHPPSLPTLSALEQLVRAWGVKSGPEPSFLMEVARQAASSPGPILECGSGLTTLVAGTYARYGLWSLEHHDAYRRVVLRLVEKCSIQNARVLLAPLVSYGNFDWYWIPSELPSRFSVIICDGPPEDTRGGRIGLMPVMGQRLAHDAVILVDDADRVGEREMLKLWQEQYGVRVTKPASARHVVVHR